MKYTVHICQTGRPTMTDNASKNTAINTFLFYLFFYILLNNKISTVLNNVGDYQSTMGGFMMSVCTR